MVRALLTCVFVLLVLAVSTPGRSDTDEVALRLAEPFEETLRWDNIEGPEAWTTGVSPSYRCDLGMHAVRLHPGEASVVFLPEGEALRLFFPEPGPLADAVEISVSDGSGLFAIAPAEPNGGAHRLIAPRLPYPALCRVALPETAGGPVEIGLFVSRTGPLPEIAPYRFPIALPGEGVALCRGLFAGHETFFPLDPDRPSEVAIDGPARLAVETRLLYPADEAARYQRYRVETLLDGAPFHPLFFETVPLATRLNATHRGVMVTGTRETAFLEIPGGSHRLTLSATLPCLARLLNQRVPDYLLPGLNAPERTAVDVRQDLVSAALSGEPWALTEAEIAGIAGDPGAPFVARERVAQRAAMESARPQGGLLGAALLNASPEGEARTEVRGQTERYVTLHTRFAGLAPSVPPGNGPQHLKRFVTPTLKAHPWERDRLVVARQHVNAWDEAVQEALFAPLSPGGDASRAAVYAVPPRLAPSTLRLVVARPDAPARLLVRIGDAAPVACRLLPDTIPPGEAFHVTMGEAALSSGVDPGYLLNGDSGGPTVPPGYDSDGPFRAFAAPLTPVSTLEIPLPAGEETVRVFQTDGPPLDVALQYRESRELPPSEAAYLAMAARNGGSLPLAALLKVLTGPEPSRASVFDRERRALFLPLSRYLAAQAALVRSRLSPPPAPGPKGKPIEPLLQRARAAEAHADWLTALALYVRVHAVAPEPQRSSIALSVVSLLTTLDEPRLAETWLTGVLLFPPGGDPAAPLADEAYQRLKALYAAGGSDTDLRDEAASPLLSLAAARVVQNPTIETVRELAGLLNENGQSRLALLACLLLPEPQRPPDTLFYAALTERWYAVAREAAKLLPAPADAAYAQGTALLAQNRTDEALAAFEKAGSRGLPMTRHITEARAIRRGLSSTSAATRRDAILRWEAWQAETPGPVAFQSAPELIQGHAGAATLISEPRDLTATVFAATPETPVTLFVQGPQTLKLLIRPLRERGDTAPRDGWVRLSDGAGLHLTPITGDQPVQGLGLIGRKGLPGRRVEIVHTVPAGPHTLSITPEGFPLLVAVETALPEFPMPLLPRLTDGIIRRLASSPAPPLPEAEPPGLTPCLPWADRLLVIPAPGSGAPVACTRLTRSVPPPPEADTADVEGFLARLDESRRQRAPQPPWRQRVAEALARGDIGGALTLTDASDADGRFLTMALLVRLAEADPDQWLGAEARGQALVSRHPDRNLAPLLARLTRRTQWQEVTQIRQSAGQRTFPVTGWTPQTPALRVRKALLPTIAPSEQIVYGASEAAFYIDKDAPTTATLTLRLADLPLLPAAPLVASVTVDGSTQSVALTPEAPKRSLRVPLPNPRHRIAVAIGEGYGNQFLGVTLTEQAATGPSQTWGVEGRQMAHVARPGMPVIGVVNGPAWVRVDRLPPGGAPGPTGPRSTFHFFDTGAHTLTLRPDKREPEALFTLQQRAMAPAPKTPSPARPVAIAYAPAAAPLFQLPAPDPVTGIAPCDRYPLSGQEDGTWAWGAAVTQRNNVQEDAARRDAERFIEARGSHLFFAPGLPGYLHTEALLRDRQDGGPTLGLSEKVRWQPEPLAPSLSAEGTLFAQNPGADGLDPTGALGTEWAASLRLTASSRWLLSPTLSHLPSVWGFGRVLSMDTLGDYDPKRVDQDLFTPYKRDHRYGWGLGDTLTWRPWLDTRLQAGLSARSNERPYSVDNLRAEAGARQLLGPFEAGLDCAFTRYLNDGDRNGAVNRSSLGLGLSWTHWQPDQRRVEVDLSLSREFVRGDTSASLAVTWFFSRSRGLRDVPPGDIAFYDLWERITHEAQNNTLSPEKAQGGSL